jgi:aldose 1-epimerase
MKSTVQKSSFGALPDGTPVDLYTLTNAQGVVAKVTNYGTVITELHVPDREGKLGDVVLGFDNLEQYLKGHPYFGCTVGRVANRIAGGKFTLGGRTFSLAVNNGPNHLHGGIKGFDKVVWAATPGDGASVKFTHLSPDGDEGYPGNLQVAVTIALTDANELSLDYTAATDQNTPVNLTNHTYFNLAGKGDILGHELMISAAHYTPTNADSIPTGEVAPVRGTPMDFSAPRPIGSRIGELTNDPRGYDTNYVINRAGKGLALLARAYDPTSGRAMEAQTTQPGVQFYTGNFLDGTLTGKNGTAYQRHAGFCLETQHYPDSVNHPSFPSTILHPGQTYHHTTVYRFFTR